jgi:isoquinoline 1-oxidoreductase beta subunit
LKHNPRALKVLDTLAAKANWTPVAAVKTNGNSAAGSQSITPAAARTPQHSREAQNASAAQRTRAGHGVAFASAFNGLIASAVDLSVTDSRIKIHRIVTVVDCGRTLDSGIAESNILGGIVWGLSGMRTHITFDQGKAVETNFNAFDPLHLWETPLCEVHFIESGAPLGGTGELGPVPIHAAVCNAIFSATAQRIRALPLSKAGLSFA